MGDGSTSPVNLSEDTLRVAARCAGVVAGWPAPRSIAQQLPMQWVARQSDSVDGTAYLACIHGALTHACCVAKQ